MVFEGDITMSETGEGNAAITSNHRLPWLGIHRSSVEHVAAEPISSNTTVCWPAPAQLAGSSCRSEMRSRLHHPGRGHHKKTTHALFTTTILQRATFWICSPPSYIRKKRNRPYLATLLLPTLAGLDRDPIPLLHVERPRDGREEQEP